MKPGSKDARTYFADGRNSILTLGAMVVERSILYGSPDKLHAWAAEGGRHKRAASQTLQPSGRLPKRFKQVGTVKTTNAMHKT